MIRRLAVLLLLTGCASGNLLAREGGSKVVTDESVIRQALGAAVPKDAQLRAWMGTPVSGVRLYGVEGGGMVPVGVLVTGSGDTKQVLRGAEAFTTLRTQLGDDDPARLAELAVHFLEPGGTGGHVIPSTGPSPTLSNAQAAVVTPPSILDGVLHYWRWPPPVASDRTTTAPEPSRCTVDLTTLAVACTRG